MRQWEMGRHGQGSHCLCDEGNAAWSPKQLLPWSQDWFALQRRESIFPSGMKTSKLNPRKFRLYPSHAQGDHTEGKTPMLGLAGNITHCH